MEVGHCVFRGVEGVLSEVPVHAVHQDAEENSKVAGVILRWDGRELFPAEVRGIVTQRVGLLHDAVHVPLSGHFEDLALQQSPDLAIEGRLRHVGQLQGSLTHGQRPPLHRLDDPQPDRMDDKLGFRKGHRVTPVLCRRYRSW